MEKPNNDSLRLRAEVPTPMLRYILLVLGISIPIGVFLAALYLTGNYYSVGYFSTYGLDADTFRQDLSRIYLRGGATISELSLDLVYAWLEIASTTIVAIFKGSLAFLFWWPIMVVVISAFVVFLVFWLEKSLGHDPKSPINLQEVYQSLTTRIANNWMQKKTDNKRPSGLLERLGYYILLPSLGFVATPFVLLAVLLVIWSLPEFAYELGKNRASAEIKEYEEHGCSPKEDESFAPCVAIRESNGNEIYTGRRLAQTKDLVALYNDEGSYVYNIASGVVIVRLSKQVPLRSDEK